MKLTNRELATVLAALRLWQDSDLEMQGDADARRFLAIAEDGGRVRSLSDEEIDALCERLNAGRPKPRKTRGTTADNRK